MSIKHWTGTTSTAYATSTNWLEGAAPTAGDAVVFDKNATQGCVGSDQSGTALASFTVYQGMRYTIGSTTTPLKIAATTVTIGTADSSGYTPGNQWVLNCTGSTAISVTGSATAGTGGLEPVLLLTNNSASSLSVTGGLVGLATIASSSATIGTVAMPSGGNGGILNLGSGVTLSTSATIASGKFNSLVAIPTLNQSGGATYFNAAAEITTLNLTGGTVFLNGRASSGSTIGTAVMTGPGSGVQGGTINLQGNAADCTIGALTYNSGSVLEYQPGQLIVSAMTWSDNGFTTLTASAR